MNEKMEELAIPLPDSRPGPNFQAPIEIARDDLQTVSLCFRWGQRTVGFGDCALRLDDGKLHADTEHMSREWLRRALHTLADTLADAAELN